MARVEGICRCSKEDCIVHNATKQAGRAGWVDAITELCRSCEIDHGKRWGHHGAKAEQGEQVQGENVIF